MIRYLKRLLRRFVDSGTSTDLSANPAAEEQLARFIFSSGHYAIDPPVVRAKAFMPDKRGETSVHRIADLADAAIWQLGDSIRRNSFGAFEQSKARGDVLTSSAISNGLRVEAAPEDHPRHAVIVGWPNVKHEQQAIALQLSKAASLRVHPTA